MYKIIRLKKDVYRELIDVVNELQRNLGKKVSFSEAVEFLLKEYKSKKIEFKV